MHVNAPTRAQTRYIFYQSKKKKESIGEPKRRCPCKKKCTS